MSGQEEFAQALLRPDITAPGGLSTWNGSDPQQRFAVYRNNVTISLIEALAVTYPVVLQLVGEPFFREMARLYARQHPPRSRIMLDYGETFPDFVANFAPASEVHYLADVARLEASRRRAYHAADAPALDQTAYTRLSAAELDAVTIRFHPSVTILQSSFAIVSLWAAHQGLMAIEDVDPVRAEDALIVRPELEVEVVRLPPGVTVFLQRLQAGACVIDAVTGAMDRTADFDIASGLATLMRSRAAAALDAVGE